MKGFQFFVFIALLAARQASLGQGTLQINFDGPPVQPSGSDFEVQSYDESGMSFYPLPGTEGFDRAWSGRPSGWPDDGTPSILTGAGESFGFNFLNGSLFGLVSVNLAAFSTGFPDYTVNFIGYHPDGSTITMSFSGNGINFQTYNFGSDWSSGLTRVEIPTDGWSLDNLVVLVPEPSFSDLFKGTFVLLFWKRGRRKLK